MSTNADSEIFHASPNRPTVIRGPVGVWRLKKSWTRKRRLCRLLKNGKSRPATGQLFPQGE
jgi:hypothetical protein